ncbi:hypothetical protein B0H34DRAFT_765375 [Crassisporium funariophilum]|nr:hypothetical protein B0H34DRAFT_765375 [Crassisporium funariophilum]
MVHDPEAFVLLNLQDATLSSSGITENGVLSLQCVTLSHPDSQSTEERDVYLVLSLNASETPIDPARVIQRTDVPGVRTYHFAGTQIDPTELVLTLKTPVPEGSHPQRSENLETFDNIIAQYAVDFRGSRSGTSPTIAPIQGQKPGVSLTGNKDLRGHLVMINEDTGEVVGEVEDRFRIREDPIMHEKGHENDPVIIEVPEQSTRESDATTLEVFARIVPPDQQTWITKSASIVSHAISMTTNILLTTITTASSYYVAHSDQSPHHSSPTTPKGSGSKSPTAGGAPPPLPPRALVFLTSEKTRKGLSTVHAMSGQAVKVSSKTVNTIDNMIRRAMGGKSKRTKYFAHGGLAAGQGPIPGLMTPGGGVPTIPPRSPSPSFSTKSGLAPPPYSSGGEKNFSVSPGGPPLPPRRSTSPAPPPLPPRTASGTPEGSAPMQPRLSTKDHILISADLILSTIDDSTRRVLDVGTQELSKVMGHKYGAEAAESSSLLAGTARNVGLVYVDMRGIGRRALLKSAGKNFVKARISSHTPELQDQQGFVHATSHRK